MFVHVICENMYKIIKCYILKEKNVYECIICCVI